MFKEIPGYESYLINESGIILNKKDNSMLRVSFDTVGYLYVTIDGHIEYVHELMARTYLPNRYIIHVDGDPLNNHISNISYSSTPENIKIVDRENRQWKSGKPTYIYEVFNNDTNDVIPCFGRLEVAKLIQYEEISLKNMVGNGRKITLGPYAGYQIRRVKRIGE